MFLLHEGGKNNQEPLKINSMEERVVMEKKEYETIARLNEVMGLGVAKEDLIKKEEVRKILLAAWTKPNRYLHRWGIPRRRLSIMVSKLGGFKNYVLKKDRNVLKVLL